MPRLSAVAIVLALAGFTPACSSSHADDATATDSGAPDSATVHVDASALDAGSDAVSPPTYTLITEPDQGMQPIYDFVSSAKKTIDMTMYGLTDTTMTGLLTTAASKGITVRVILDQNLEMSDNTTAYDTLSATTVQVHWADTTYAATHQKTITIDGVTSAIMTLNFTPEYYSTTRDFAVITSDAKDVAAIETVFGDDFTNTAVTPPLGDNLVWSPTNSQTAMLGVINGAKSTLIVENEEMSDDAVISALSASASRGVKVEVVMTASKELDSTFTTLMGTGVDIVTYARDAALYIHAKVILADYGKTGATVFIGSENFSSASLTKNRELGVILTDPAILTSINATLTSDFKGGTAY